MTIEDGGPLKGEGDVKHVTRTRQRRECSVCGEPATKRHTYMLPNARSNPNSSGYRRDDISWCADEESYTCNACPPPTLDGYGSCSTFHAAQHEPYNHMLLEWVERPCPPQPDPVREELVELLKEAKEGIDDPILIEDIDAALSRAKEGQ